MITRGIDTTPSNARIKHGTPLNNLSASRIVACYYASCAYLLYSLHIDTLLYKQCLPLIDELTAYCWRIIMHLHSGCCWVVMHGMHTCQLSHTYCFPLLIIVPLNSTLHSLLIYSAYFHVFPLHLGYCIPLLAGRAVRCE